MEQSKLDLVRQKYDELCALRKKILEAQDTKIDKESSPSVRRYKQLLDLIDFYERDEYFEDYQRRLDTLLKSKSVIKYLETKDDKLLEDDDVFEYVDLSNLVKIDRKAEIVNMKKEIENLLNDNDLKAYLEAVEILKIEEEEDHINSEHLQQLAFDEAHDKDNTYLKIRDNNLVRIINMDTGSCRIYDYNDKKLIDAFRKTHCVIGNPNVSFLGISHLKYDYRNFYLKDRNKDAKTATKEARQYLRNYGKN